MKKIGVFVCWCGRNIGGIVDVPQVVEAMKDYPGVAVAKEYKYMCSDPGQDLIRESIEEYQLDGVVVAACSPNMHEATFRTASASAGLNPYQCEMANIREQCSWVHEDEPERATQKAIELVRTIVEKVREDRPLEPITFEVQRSVLVVGGGVAGLEVSRNVALSGYPVVLVERSQELGGRVASLATTYMFDDPAYSMVEGIRDEVTQLDRVEIHTSSQVSQVSGYVGNFTVTIETPEGEVEKKVGAVVLAPGFSTLDLSALPEYGGGRLPDVVDALTFERMLAEGDLVRPSDGRPVEDVAFVKCAGSRDTERGVPYCSRVCCTYTAKQARHFLNQRPQGQAQVLYMDIRSAGKGHEEYVQEGIDDQGIVYLRGRPSRIYQEGERVRVETVDTLASRPLVLDVDLVVLATAMVPAEGARDLARLFKVGTDAHGFYSEAHPKLQPVESLTQGVYLAGAAQAPRDIPDSISQAGAVASKVVGLFSRDLLEHSPTVVEVDPELCSACGLCVEFCPYEARSKNPVLKAAEVNAVLCQGCGGCQAVCPSGATQHVNSTRRQIMSMLDSLW